MQIGIENIKLLSRFFAATCLITLLAVSSFGQDQHKLLSLDGAGLDQFGKSVDIWDTLVIVGCIGDDDNGINSGSAYVFRKSGTSFPQGQKLIASDGSAYDNFGISVAIFDTVAMVGANFDDPKGNNSGSVYVYHYNGNSWVQVQKLSPADGAAGDEFGFSLSLWNNMAVIGAYKDDVGNPQSGSVYIYRFNGSTWIEEDKLNAFDNNVDDFFGYDTDIYDSLIIVGAYQDDDNGTNSGSAYIYHNSGFGWLFDQKLIASNGEVGDAFGFSVSVYDKIAAIGAYARNANHLADGTVYVFTFDGNAWNEDAQLVASDGGDDDWLGFSVAVSGVSIVAGAFHDDDLGSESGAAYLYRHDGQQWIEELKLKASDGELGDQFGGKVAISGFNVAIGALYDDDNGTDAGAAYVYPLCTYKPVQQICAVTVDSTSSYVEVVWNKPLTSFIDSFFIYRDVFDDSAVIASLAYSELPNYNDTVVNPDNNSFMYEISTLNICGFKAAMSDTVSTIHLSAVHGTGSEVELSWTAYQNPTPTYYRIWRDTLGNGSYELIHATQNFEFAFTDINAPAAQPLKYVIEAEYPFACLNGLDSAISNAADPFVIGVDDYAASHSVCLFPNPAGDVIYIRDQFRDVLKLQLFDLAGQEVFSHTIVQGAAIDIGTLPAGAYLYCITFDTMPTSRGMLIHH